jgi:hypothetical protein
MKKLLLISILLTAQIVVWAQPCTPPTSFPASQGILPLELGFAYLDTAYRQVIEFKAPLDTNVVFNNQPVAFRVDSLRILNVLGLPQGISYQCHNEACRVNGGEIGCAVISGQAIQGGVFPLQVIVRTWGKVQAFIPLPINNIDTNERYTLFVFPTTGLTGVFKGQYKLDVFPNPAKDFINIKTGPTYQGMLEVFDITGKRVYSKVLSESLDQTHNIYTQNWESGIYHVLWRSAEQVFKQKLIIE